MKFKTLTKDFVLSLCAVALMNFTLQILVYPYLQHLVGENAFGQIIYYLGVIDIFAPGIGLACNNERLLRQRSDVEANGNYLFVIALLGGITGTGVWLFLHDFSPLAFFILYFFTILRTYLVVQFRLTLNYTKFFLYYFCISAGYLLGALLFYPRFGWIAIFLTGEIAGVLYFCVTGNFLKPPYHLTPELKSILRKVTVLALASISSNCVVYMDRILLGMFIDSSAVTRYYVSSLLGKTVIMMIAPLSAVLISYLTKMKGRLRLSLYLKLCAFCSVGAFITYIGILIAYPLFIQILYPNLYDQVISYGALGNLAPILFAIGNLLLTLLLVICSETWQLIIQLGYLVLFVIFTVSAISFAGFYGFVLAAILANFLRLCVIVCVGIFYLRKHRTTLSK